MMTRMDAFKNYQNSSFIGRAINSKVFLEPLIRYGIMWAENPEQWTSHKKLQRVQSRINKYINFSIGEDDKYKPIKEGGGRVLCLRNLVLSANSNFFKKLVNPITVHMKYIRLILLPPWHGTKAHDDFGQKFVADCSGSLQKSQSKMLRLKVSPYVRSTNIRIVHGKYWNNVQRRFCKKLPMDIQRPCIWCGTNFINLLEKQRANLFWALKAS